MTTMTLAETAKKSAATVTTMQKLKHDVAFWQERAKAFLNLYDQTGDDAYLVKAEKCLGQTA